ncbi:hypothetical protein OIE43_43965 [Streptomyces pseudovenezuelae]|uniref:Uncharacterized protein n=1 Tax=Streptomyces pseudovenezuelae TaxID=67350 RepID=A0ABZ1X9Q0_9ACTN|nr:hypothetical protein [Streptomyces pseudovenezuelae]
MLSTRAGVPGDEPGDVTTPPHVTAAEPTPPAPPRGLNSPPDLTRGYRPLSPDGVARRAPEMFSVYAGGLDAPPQGEAFE